MRHQPGETFLPCPVEEKRDGFLTEILAEVFDIHVCQCARRPIQASTLWGAPVASLSSSGLHRDRPVNLLNDLTAAN